ncbi:MAG TPA: hypothetical protein VGB64_12275 [Actinomycetota bacterium]
MTITWLAHSPRRRVAAGMALGILAASFGPLMADVGSQSGNHPQRPTSGTWIYADQRSAAAGNWDSEAFSDGFRIWHEITVSAWDRETRVIRPDQQETIATSRGATLTHLITTQDQSTYEKTSSTRRMYADPAAMSFGADPVTGTAWLRATARDHNGVDCDVVIDWIPYENRTHGQSQTVNTIEQWRWVTGTASGSCMTDIAEEDRVRGYSKVWRRIERRTSDEPISDDRLAPRGIITYAGVGAEGAAGDGGPATSAFLSWPTAIKATPDGGTVILEGWGGRLRRVTPGGVAETIVAGGCTSASDRQLPDRICYATDIAVGADGTIFIADSGARAIRRIERDGTHHIHTTFGTDPDWYGIQGIAVAPDGRVFVSDGAQHRVLEVDATGAQRAIAGDGTCNQPRDGIPATQSSVCYPGKMALGPDGSLYVVEETHGVIRRIDRDGTISTAFGSQPPGAVGYASSRYIDGIAIGPDGRLYASKNEGTVYRIEATNLAIPVAGGNTCWACGDGSLATLAYLQRPTGIDFDAQGHLLIAESEGHRVRLADVGTGRS